MAITCTGEGRVRTAELRGEVDHHRARELMRELETLVDTTAPRELILDLSGVTFMDSSGIAVVLRTWRQVKALGGELRLAGVPEQAGKVLRAAGVERLVTVE